MCLLLYYLALTEENCLFALVITKYNLLNTGYSVYPLLYKFFYSCEHQKSIKCPTSLMSESLWSCLGSLTATMSFVSFLRHFSTSPKPPCPRTLRNLYFPGSSKGSLLRVMDEIVVNIFSAIFFSQKAEKKLEKLLSFTVNDHNSVLILVVESN